MHQNISISKYRVTNTWKSYFHRVVFFEIVTCLLVNAWAMRTLGASIAHNIHSWFTHRIVCPLGSFRIQLTFQRTSKIGVNFYKLWITEITIINNQWRIQDFPEGGAWTLQGGREHAKFSRKLHEIERIWTPRGGRASLTPPLDPPMIIIIISVPYWVAINAKSLFLLGWSFVFREGQGLTTSHCYQQIHLLGLKLNFVFPMINETYL